MGGHHYQPLSLVGQWIFRSMQDEFWDSRWVGCDISWWNPCTLVRDSSCVPSVVVLSLVHQTEDLILKSPKIIANKPLLEGV